MSKNGKTFHGLLSSRCSCVTYTFLQVNGYELDVDWLDLFDTALLVVQKKISLLVGEELDEDLVERMVRRNKKISEYYSFTN